MGRVPPTPSQLAHAEERLHNHLQEENWNLLPQMHCSLLVRAQLRQHIASNLPEQRRVIPSESRSSTSTPATTAAAQLTLWADQCVR